MTHLGQESPAHISIRLWQWLQDNPGFRMGFGPTGAIGAAGAARGAGQAVKLIGPRLIDTRTGQIIARSIPARQVTNTSDLIAAQRAVNTARRNRDFAEDFRVLTTAGPPGEKTHILQGLLIAAGAAATAAGARAVSRLSNKDRSVEGRLNRERQYRAYPEGTRATSQGKNYIKFNGSWWLTN
jgi:hypothetical protein